MELTFPLVSEFFLPQQIIISFNGLPLIFIYKNKSSLNNISDLTLDPLVDSLESMNNLAVFQLFM